jgi:GTP-binding protein LepA
VVNGKISKGEKVKFMATDKVYEADEVGTLKLKQVPNLKLNVET